MYLVVSLFIIWCTEELALIALLPYSEAKYLTKKNTFNDFVDIARWLVGEDTVTNSQSIGQGITSPHKLSCEGRSAGGLLIGACLNQQPDLFQAAILGVPFVDVTCTMIDSTVPLTVPEWEEWGCPNEGECTCLCSATNIYTYVCIVSFIVLIFCSLYYQRGVL